ncbi:MAG: hypothetical protein JSV76_06730 [Candidatus Bathyarchaeota archaeon]|nr:MAG: hypothetical protein JSV76_06730 [Candidatus Bathyarchaeota archaeon]
MNENGDRYFFYKKLITQSLDKTIENTAEYKSLSKCYPHLVRSIELMREKNKLSQKIKSLKGSAKLLERGKMFAIDARLRRINMLKRLFGENQPETKYKIRFALERLRTSSQESASSLSRKSHNAKRLFDQKRQDFLRRNLPPQIFDLKSLDMIEKGSVLREWVQKTRDDY